MPSYIKAKGLRPDKPQEGDAVTEQVTEVKAETVEVGEDKDLVFAMDREKAIQFIQSKHKDKFIAWVNKDDCGYSYNKWQYLRMINEGTEVEVVKSKDEADKTTSNVLCWRDRKYQDIVDKKIRDANIQSLRREMMQGTSQGQADSVNQQLAGISGVKATPLTDPD